LLYIPPALPMESSTFCPHGAFIYFLRIPDRQRLFSYTALTLWLCEPRRNVFTARYGLGL